MCTTTVNAVLLGDMADADEQSAITADFVTAGGAFTLTVDQPFWSDHPVRRAPRCACSLPCRLRYHSERAL